MDRNSHIKFWEGFLNGFYSILCLPGIVFLTVFWFVIDYLVFIAGGKLAFKEVFKFKALATVPANIVLGLLFIPPEMMANDGWTMREVLISVTAIIVGIGLLKFNHNLSDEEY